MKTQDVGHYLIINFQSRLKSLALICTSATGLFAGYCLMNEDEQFYEKALIPLTHCFNPETAHNMAVMANKYRLIPKSPYKDPPSLVSALESSAKAYLAG